MAASHDYDESLRRRVGEGVTDPQDLVYAAAFEDLGEAAALFRPDLGGDRRSGRLRVTGGAARPRL
jgi:hypothetical protein